MKRILTALAASTILAFGAQAADLATKYPVKAVVAAPAFSWTGFYIGGNVGYAWGDLGMSNVMSGVPLAPSSYAGDFSPNGAFAGGQVGYNYQFSNNVVLGVEADIQWSDMSDTNFLGDEAKLDYFGTVRARLGYAFDRVLPYITGGFAYGHGKGTLNYTYPVTASFSDSATHTGWTIGGGVEYAITNNWTAKVEYLYIDLGSQNYDFNYATADIDFSASTLKLGVNYKF